MPLAGVVAGELCAGDDLETLEWVPLAEPLPEMAFEADEHIIERYRQTKLERGLPVDPDFAEVINDEERQTEAYSGPTCNLPDTSAGRARSDPLCERQQHTADPQRCTHGHCHLGRPALGTLAIGESGGRLGGLGALGGLHMAPTGYCIRIQGHLAPEWSEWFDGMIVQCQPDGTTTLSGPVRDQAALHGLLRKVRDLGMPLLSVIRVQT